MPILFCHTTSVFGQLAGQRAFVCDSLLVTPITSPKQTEAIVQVSVCKSLSKSLDLNMTHENVVMHLHNMVH